MLYYTSTRDASIKFTFEKALSSGYAPDGGLFVPATLPRGLITPDLLRDSWSKLPYPDLAFQVLREFVDDSEVPDSDLKQICDAAYVGFDNPAEAVKVLQFSNNNTTNTNTNTDDASFFMAELFHGPTFCFKDLGMQAVIGLLSYFCTKRQRDLTLIVSTTGDTGPAAVQAVKDNENKSNSNDNSNSNGGKLSILVHYPDGQISDLQRKQLTTVRSSRVKVVAFEGGGDDMDLPIKRILAADSSNSSDNDNNNDDNDNDKAPIYTGVNSYNIGRPILQMVHYIWTYMRVVEFLTAKGSSTTNSTGNSTSCDYSQPIDIVLPTGAMGNIAGGYMCKLMGLPINKLCAGVNINDISHRVVQTGEFTRADAMLPTLSEAINIQVPYNFERILYYLTNEKFHDLIKQYYTVDMPATQRIKLSKDWTAKLQSEFASARVTDDEMCTTIRDFYDQHNGYLLDPHTAVAVSAAKQLGYPVLGNTSNIGSNTKQPLPPVAILSTASPCKFEESVTTAIGKEKWLEYCQSTVFPPAARKVLEMEEIAPIKYTALDSLEKSHEKWEQMARELLAELANAK